MIREADACLQIDPSVASPVVSLNRALRDYAVRVLAVESEVREGLDAESVGARLSPVVDVRGDRIVLLRSCPDWDAMSVAEPDVVASVGRGLGFRRAIDTSMLLAAMSASSELSTDVPPVKVVVGLDAGSLTDNRGVSHIQLLLEVVGLAPEHVVIELNSSTIDAVGQDRLSELARLGVGVGVTARHSGTWRPAAALAGGDLASVTVELGDLLRNDGTLAIERIESLRALLAGSLDRVTVLGVDDATSAVELSALGLVLQSGWVHGRTMDPTELRDWMISRKS